MNTLIHTSPYSSFPASSTGLDFLRRGEVAEHLGFILVLALFAGSALFAVSGNL